jgi:hypothetical protein
MRCCGPAAPLATSARLRRCGRCSAAASPPPPPPPPSRARQAKNPADWGRDYDAIRDSLHRDKAFLARELTRIACDVPVNASPAALLRRTPDLPGFEAFCDQAKFGTMLRRQAARMAAALEFAK